MGQIQLTRRDSFEVGVCVFGGDGGAEGKGTMVCCVGGGGRVLLCLPLCVPSCVLVCCWVGLSRLQRSPLLVLELPLGQAVLVVTVVTLNSVC